MGYFLPFYFLTAWKIKIKKKWKKHLKISLFYNSVPKIMIICYTVPEIWCMTDVTVIFHFGLFFTLLPPKQPKKTELKKKMKKVPGSFHHFTYVYQKLWSDDVWFLRYGAQQMDGQTDRWTEKVTYRGGCPNKKGEMFCFMLMWFWLVEILKRFYFKGLLIGQIF